MADQKKVLIIGGATLDTIIQYEQMETMQLEKPTGKTAYCLLEEGAKIEVAEQMTFTGGGGTNAAVSFVKQGYEVTCLCKVGQDPNGKILIDELESYGVNIDYITHSNTFNTAGSFVVPTLSGDRIVFAYRGANTHLLAQDIPDDVFKHKDLIYITSLSKDSAAQLPEIVKKAKAHNVPVAINPGISQLKLGSAFLKSALHGIDTLILNYQEASQFMYSLMQVDESLHCEAPDNLKENHSNTLLDKVTHMQEAYFSLRYFFQEVLKLGPSSVVVTNGNQGVYVATKEKMYFHKTHSVKINNTLGAGDAFGSSFSGAIYQNIDIKQAMKHGIVNSASVIQFMDAKTGLLNLDEIKESASRLPNDSLIELDW